MQLHMSCVVGIPGVEWVDLLLLNFLEGVTLWIVGSISSEEEVGLHISFSNTNHLE